MIGFRGLDWIYDVTQDTHAMAARARGFERQIAATWGRPHGSSRGAGLRLMPPAEFRTSGRVLATKKATAPLDARTTRCLEPSAA